MNDERNNNFIPRINPIHYWVQTILPQVYDDALSYQELLYKVIAKVNEVIENVKEFANSINTEFDNFTDNINDELKKMNDKIQGVIDYVDGLDIEDKLEQEIDKQLKDILNSDYINNIVNETVGSAVTEAVLKDWHYGNLETFELDNQYYESIYKYFNGILGNNYPDENKDMSYMLSTKVTGEVPQIAFIDKYRPFSKTRFSQYISQNFKFAYRSNDPTVTAQDILAECERNKLVCKMYSWVYTTELAPAGSFNTIPLYDKADPAVVLNKNGKCTSCATAICNILYNLGYTDLAGDAKYTEARVKNYSLPYYLDKKGWELITNFNDLQKGDIVFCYGCYRTDERRYNPSHSFVYAGTNADNVDIGYDWGSTALVQNGGTNVVNWSNDGDDFVSSWQEYGLFNGYGTYASSMINGNQKWIGLNFPFADQGTRAIMYNADSMKTAVFFQEPDTQNTGNFVNTRVQYPIVKTSAWKGATVAIYLYEDGKFVIKGYGALNVDLTANTTYRILSFNMFDNPNHKFINNVFNKYCMIGYNKVVRIYTENGLNANDQNVTFVNLQTIDAIPKGDLVLYEVGMKN